VRLAAAVLVAVFIGAGCSSEPSPSPSPTAEQPSPTVASAPGTSQPSLETDQVAGGDAECRASPFGSELGTLTLSNLALTDLVTILYTSPETDAVCQFSTLLFGAALVQQGNGHLADQVSAQTPLVVASGTTWSSQSGSYAWGAIGPGVASVMIEIPGADQRLEADIADGYFLAVIGPEMPCCVATVIALDASGAEIARADV
jgi:hypothetical protein